MKIKVVVRELKSSMHKVGELYTPDERYPDYNLRGHYFVESGGASDRTHRSCLVCDKNWNKKRASVIFNSGDIVNNDQAIIHLNVGDHVVYLSGSSPRSFELEVVEAVEVMQKNNIMFKCIYCANLSLDSEITPEAEFEFCGLNPALSKVVKAALIKCNTVNCCAPMYVVNDKRTPVLPRVCNYYHILMDNSNKLLYCHNGSEYPIKPSVLQSAYNARPVFGTYSKKEALKKVQDLCKLYGLVYTNKTVNI